MGKRRRAKERLSEYTDISKHEDASMLNGKESEGFANIWSVGIRNPNADYEWRKRWIGE
jgi:hypothetical protein